MPKIENIANLIKAKMADWEANSDQKIFFQKDPLEALDRYEYLEIMMAELIGGWYFKTKEIIKNRGTHTLGFQREVLKDCVAILAIRLREKKEEEAEFARGHLFYKAANLFEYAKSVYRRKNVK